MKFRLESENHGSSSIYGIMRLGYVVGIDYQHIIAPTTQISLHIFASDPICSLILSPFFSHRSPGAPLTPAILYY